MTAVYLITIVCCSVLALATLSLLAYLYVSLLRRNRLFAAAIVIALALHVVVGGACWLFRGTVATERPDTVVHIAPLAAPLPDKLPTPPKLTLPKLPVLPQGHMDGDRHARTNPFGHHPQNHAPGDPNAGPAMKTGPSAPPPVKVLLRPSSTPEDAIPQDNSNPDVLNPSFLRTVIGPGGCKGKPGDDGGYENGTGNGPFKAGIEIGKRDGRVYFVRLKHGGGAWNAHAEGTRRLLAFLNTYFPCESESWPMTAAELRDRYLDKGMQPCFLYLYCDDSFSLSATEVKVLRAYMAKGGFLFLDSRPDPAIKELVTGELAKILPGARLVAIPKNHPINSFLFRLTSPGVGLNVIERTNYGIMQDNRVVVFYTPGNFTQLYASFPPAGDEYVTAQYQMGANVMLYAIRRGDATNVPREHGANAEISNQTVNRLLDGGNVPSPAPSLDAPRKPVKITPDGGGSGQPEDINLRDE